ncbi:MAG: PEP-CTERM sorting domain-containing protein [Verrucomicrobia bacterium]|nr:PEP-CTERM sorting domain-containing protein [Verrucomicrobiota bacterium]
MKTFLAVVGTVGIALSSQAAALLTETFTYADGDLTNVSAGAWSYHSITGTGYPATALNNVLGQAFINQNDGGSGMGDANRLLSSTFDPATDNTSSIYSSFTVNFIALPFLSGTAVSGSYFAHIRGSAGSEFYARVSASTTGAAAGSFRLGIGNEAGTPVFLAQDLNLNTSYTVVTRLSLATDLATLWVNPTLETDPSVTGADVIGYSGLINSYALRQGTTGTSPNVGAPGDLYLDNLKVATSFDEAIAPIPEPSSLALVGMSAGIAMILRRRK